MDFLKKRVFFFGLLGFVIAINLYILSFKTGLWWDEGVYIGISKYIWSFGNAGYFEVIRPPVLPIIIGAFWFLGANPIIAGKAIILLFFIGLLFLTYEIGRNLWDRFTGFYSALLLASTPFIYSYSTKILSGIPAAFFALLGIYIYLSNKKPKALFFCGVALGLSFLMRFPGGIAFGVLALFVFLHNIKNIKLMLKNGVALFSGFSLIVAPYIIYNFYAYGNALLPFFAASRIIDATAWFHKSGVFFYTIELFYHNPFFIFLVFGIAYMLYQKSIQKMHILIGFMFLAYFSYFSFFLEAKELRFSLIFLPYVALIASLGMNRLLKAMSVLIYQTDAIKKLKTSNAKNVFTVLFIAISFMTVSFGVVTLTSSHLRWLEDPQTQDPYNEFLLFVENHSTNASILTSNPTIAAYTDSRVSYLRGWVAADEIYTREKDISSTLIIDTCALDCAPDDFICHESKDKFIAKTKKENTELFSTTANITGRLCTYSVYEINDFEG